MKAFCTITLAVHHDEGMHKGLLELTKGSGMKKHFCGGMPLFLYIWGLGLVEEKKWDRTTAKKLERLDWMDFHFFSWWRASWRLVTISTVFRVTHSRKSWFLCRA